MQTMTAVCPQCEGRSVVLVPLKCDPTMCTIKSCPTCKGKGTVEVKR
jgi:DnaJ-class molecular chaperone